MKKLLLALLFPFCAGAAPGPFTESLMNEPASMLDIGMLRLQMLTTEFERRVGLHWTKDGKYEYFKASVNQRYDAEDDRIYVGIAISTDTATEAQMAEGCEYAMRQLGYWLAKFAGTSFMHVGDRERGKWREMDATMRELIVMRCYVHGETSSSEGRFWAHRVLGATEVTVGRWPLKN